ncbi:peptidoglycan DD-metalloendopeptidase family protein [Allosaccharopolyspora coralli]|uniref:Peptidoglycan DD-metalloendopeptidase family protein n=1 Tax=Allosaccharopolyspora coralli TaxID=2665642 RepID=A0A5Q3QD35_9PSEU|nr:peptidoglycan DD-metalloendopeptidase family protein [Allosaccharopolyspora coralli]
MVSTGSTTAAAATTDLGCGADDAFHPSTPAPPGTFRISGPTGTCRSAPDPVAPAAADPAPRSSPWVVPTRGTCTSEFGARSRGFHEGLDFGAPVGEPIVAASEGTVVDAGPASGYGLWVRVDHGGGVVTTYGHNDRNLVHRGASVRAGDVVATVGNRGQSTGPHLHFQTEVDGNPVDPESFYQQRGAPPLCGTQ